MRNIQVSIEMAFKYILVYSFSVHLAVHFNHISKIIKITMKLHIKCVKKAFESSANCIECKLIQFLLIAFNMKLRVQKKLKCILVKYIISIINTCFLKHFLKISFMTETFVWFYFSLLYAVNSYCSICQVI